MCCLIYTRSPPERCLSWRQFFHVGMLGFAKINVEMNDPFQSGHHQNEPDGCPKQDKHKD